MPVLRCWDPNSDPHDFTVKWETGFCVDVCFQQPTPRQLLINALSITSIPNLRYKHTHSYTSNTRHLGYSHRHQYSDMSSCSQTMEWRMSPDTPGNVLTICISISSPTSQQSISRNQLTPALSEAQLYGRCRTIASQTTEAGLPNPLGAGAQWSLPLGCSGVCIDLEF